MKRIDRVLIATNIILLCTLLIMFIRNDLDITTKNIYDCLEYCIINTIEYYRMIFSIALITFWIIYYDLF